MLKDVFYQNKFLHLTSIFIICLMLSGCNEDKVSGATDNDDSDFEINIKEYPVSTEYYTEITNLITEFNKYAVKATNENLSRSNLESISLDYLVLLNGADESPITDVDFEFERYMVDFRYEAKMVASKMVDYASSDKLSDKNDAINYLNELINTQKVIKEMILKYELNK